MTGEDVELLWVKGSGGDLGTLKAEDLAVLRLDRLQALKNVYPGVEREDEMVAAFDYCLHGKGGAAPSIDTAMHGLVDAAHVDHLHPDSGHRHRHGRRRRGADQGDLRREGGLGAVAAPRLPAGPGHRRDQGRQPAGRRHHPGRPRHHRLGRHQRGSRSQLAVDHRAGRAVHQGPRQGRTLRAEAARLRRPAGGRAPREGRRPGPRDPRPGLHGQAAAGALQRRPRRPGVPGSRRAPAARAPWARPARTTSCAPRSSR